MWLVERRQNEVDSSIENRIAELPKLTKSALKSLWLESLGRPAPPRLRRQAMIPVLAYRIQERAYGGLKPSTLKRLRALAEALERNPSAVLTDSPRIRAGTRLIREWRGEKHEVMVDGSGYEYRGKKFASLSEIARHITGTRWSGPLFFGLKTGKDRTAK
jgi:hypothetical protein